MKKILTSLLMLLVIANVESSVVTTFERANQLYAEKNYAKAAELYETIIVDEGVAPELYYNLGNAYFKSNELAKAILNYERALRIAPGYADAEFNLEFANQQVIDNIEQADTFFLKKWITTLMKTMTSNNWFYISAMFFVISLIAFLIFVFGHSKLIRKFFFYMGLIGILLTVTTIIFAGIRKTQMMNRNEAIVLSGVIVIKGAPDKSGTDLYQLHEGSKITIIGSLGDWYEVRLGNGNVGWVESTLVEKI